MRPEGPPIGLHLAATAKAVSRAFNATLAEAGGSLPTWLILTSLRGEQWRTQQELARALGIEGATLTRHLDALERAGLVERRRDPHDRRAIQVELTNAGEALHSRLRHNVVAFDRQLRSGLGDAELERLRATLRRLEQNAASRDRD